MPINQESGLDLSKEQLPKKTVMTRRELLKHLRNTGIAVAILRVFGGLGFGGISPVKAEGLTNKTTNRIAASVTSPDNLDKKAHVEEGPNNFERVIATAPSVRLNPNEADLFVRKKMLDRSIPLTAELQLSATDFYDLASDFSENDEYSASLFNRIANYFTQEENLSLILNFRNMAGNVENSDVVMSMSFRRNGTLLLPTGNKEDSQLMEIPNKQSDVVIFTAPMVSEFNAMNLTDPEGNKIRVSIGDAVSCLTFTETVITNGKSQQITRVSSVFYKKADGNIGELSLKTWYVENIGIRVNVIASERVFISHSLSTETLKARQGYEVLCERLTSQIEKQYLIKMIPEILAIYQKSLNASFGTRGKTKDPNSRGSVELDIDDMGRYVLNYKTSSYDPKKATYLDFASRERYLLVKIPDQNAIRIGMVPFKTLGATTATTELSSRFVTEQLHVNAPETVPDTELDKNYDVAAVIPSRKFSKYERAFFGDNNNYPKSEYPDSSFSIEEYPVVKDKDGVWRSQLSQAIRDTLVIYTQEKNRGLDASSILSALVLPSMLEQFLGASQVQRHLDQLVREGNESYSILIVNQATEGTVACKIMRNGSAGKKELVEVFTLDSFDENGRIVTITPSETKITPDTIKLDDKSELILDSTDKLPDQQPYITFVTPELKIAINGLGVAVEEGDFVLLSIVPINVREKATGNVKKQFIILGVSCDLNQGQVQWVPDLSNAPKKKRVTAKSTPDGSAPRYELAARVIPPAEWKIGSREVVVPSEYIEDRVARDKPYAIYLAEFGIGMSYCRKGRGIDDADVRLVDPEKSPEKIQEFVAPLGQLRGNREATYLLPDGTEGKVGKTNFQVEIVEISSLDSPEIRSVITGSIDTTKFSPWDSKKKSGSKATAEGKDDRNVKFIRIYNPETNVVTVFVIIPPGYTYGAGDTTYSFAQAAYWAFAGDDNDKGHLTLSQAVNRAENTLFFKFPKHPRTPFGVLGNSGSVETYNKWVEEANKK